MKIVSYRICRTRLIQYKTVTNKSFKFQQKPNSTFVVFIQISQRSKDKCLNNMSDLTATHLSDTAQLYKQVLLISASTQSRKKALPGTLQESCKFEIEP